MHVSHVLREIIVSPSARSYGLGGLHNRSLFRTVLEAEKSTFWCLVRAWFLVCRWLSSHSFTWWRERSTSFSYRSTNPFIRAPPLWLNHLPKAPSSSTITLWIGFQHMNSGRGGPKYSVHSKYHPANRRRLCNYKERNYLLLGKCCQIYMYVRQHRSGYELWAEKLTLI